jgi:hypothetical protein
VENFASCLLAGGRTTCLHGSAICITVDELPGSGGWQQQHHHLVGMPRGEHEVLIGGGR